MSSKKIIRLKTPSRAKEAGKSAESTFATHIHCGEEETITKVRNLEYSESLQATLINEINKLYREIQQ